MVSSNIAKKYAKCIFDLHGFSFQEELYSLNEFLNKNPNVLKEFFCNIHVPINLKTKILDTSCNNKNFILFVNLLLKNKDFHMIKEIVFEYDKILLDAKGEIYIDVKSANSVLSDDQRNTILYIAKKYTNKNGIINVYCDKSIIAGFIANFDGKVINCSLYKILSSLQDLSKKVIVE